jgi:hypothetical protein
MAKQHESRGEEREKREEKKKKMSRHVPPTITCVAPSRRSCCDISNTTMNDSSEKSACTART